MKKLIAILIGLCLLFVPSEPVTAKKGGKARAKLGGTQKEQAQMKARKTREKHKLEGKKRKKRSEAAEHH